MASVAPSDINEAITYLQTFIDARKHASHASQAPSPVLSHTSHTRGIGVGVGVVPSASTQHAEVWSHRGHRWSGNGPSYTKTRADAIYMNGHNSPPTRSAQRVDAGNDAYHHPHGDRYRSSPRTGSQSEKDSVLDWRRRLGFPIVSGDEGHSFGRDGAMDYSQHTTPHTRYTALTHVRRHADSPHRVEWSSRGRAVDTPPHSRPSSSSRRSWRGAASGYEDAVVHHHSSPPASVPAYDASPPTQNTRRSFSSLPASPQRIRRPVIPHIRWGAVASHSPAERTRVHSDRPVRRVRSGDRCSPSSISSPSPSRQGAPVPVAASVSAAASLNCCDADEGPSHTHNDAAYNVHGTPHRPAMHTRHTWTVQNAPVHDTTGAQGLGQSSREVSMPAASASASAGNATRLSHTPLSVTVRQQARLAEQAVGQLADRLAAADPAAPIRPSTHAHRALVAALVRYLVHYYQRPSVSAPSGHAAVDGTGRGAAEWMRLSARDARDLVRCLHVDITHVTESARPRGDEDCSSSSSSRNGQVQSCDAAGVEEKAHTHTHHASHDLSHHDRNYDNYDRRRRRCASPLHRLTESNPYDDSRVKHPPPPPPPTGHGRRKDASHVHRSHSDHAAHDSRAMHMHAARNVCASHTRESVGERAKQPSQDGSFTNSRASEWHGQLPDDYYPHRSIAPCDGKQNREAKNKEKELPHAMHTSLRPENRFAPARGVQRIEAVLPHLDRPTSPSRGYANDMHATPRRAAPPPSPGGTPTRPVRSADGRLIQPPTAFYTQRIQSDTDKTHVYDKKLTSPASMPQSCHPYTTVSLSPSAVQAASALSPWRHGRRRGDARKDEEEEREHRVGAEAASAQRPATGTPTRRPALTVFAPTASLSASAVVAATGAPPLSPEQQRRALQSVPCCPYNEQSTNISTNNNNSNNNNSNNKSLGNMRTEPNNRIEEDRYSSVHGSAAASEGDAGGTKRRFDTSTVASRQAQTGASNQSTSSAANFVSAATMKRRPDHGRDDRSRDDASATSLRSGHRTSRRSTSDHATSQPVESSLVTATRLNYNQLHNQLNNTSHRNSDKGGHIEDRAGASSEARSRPASSSSRAAAAAAAAYSLPQRRSSEGDLHTPERVGVSPSSALGHASVSAASSGARSARQRSYGRSPQRPHHAHSLRELMAVLRKGTTMLKHSAYNRQPNLLFFRVLDRPTEFQGRRVLMPHLTWTACHNAEATDGETAVDAALNLIELHELHVGPGQDDGEVGHLLFFRRHGHVLDEHQVHIPHHMCAVLSFASRNVAVSFLSERDRQLWIPALREVVKRNHQLKL